ncbi:hypothetical protein JXQ31_12325 [candidate division KSB1 bacterium]|nr:hypothetical protein [candidate division KSB1 bacterium]
MKKVPVRPVPPGDTGLPNARFFRCFRSNRTFLSWRKIRRDILSCTAVSSAVHLLEPDYIG